MYLKNIIPVLFDRSKGKDVLYKSWLRRSNFDTEFFVQNSLSV